MKKIKNNDGYTILSILLVVVVSIVSIGAWSLSGATNNSQGASSSADVMATTIISQGAALQVLYEGVKIKGYTALGNEAIEYFPNAEDVPQNMLSPSSGEQAPIVPVKAIKDNPNAQEGFWIYLLFGLTGNGIGTTTGHDQAMILMGVKDSVCQRINYNLYGSTTIPSLGYTYTISNLITKLTPMYNGLLPMTSVTAVKGWMNGCINVTPGTSDKNMYYKILQAN